MKTKRYSLPDTLRGAAIFNMILYHSVWDLVYLFDFDWPWYQSAAAYVWQQFICWTFIFISGFCQPMAHHRAKNGIRVFLAGMLISAVTLIAIPQEKILFGVLTLIGTSMLLLLPLDSFFKRRNPLGGFAVSLVLFAVTKNVNLGYLGFENWNLYPLPDSWYHNLGTAFLGFPPPDFSSEDYFSLIPWVFLFAAGYFFYYILARKGWMGLLEKGCCKPLEWIGRHSLVIYMIHQPVLYLVFWIIFEVLRTSFIT